MLPKKSNHFIKPTADELGCDVELVEDTVGFFYSFLRKNLIELTGPNIQVENLGSFKIKPKELPKLVAKYKTHLGVLKPETFNQMVVKKDIELKLVRVTNLQKTIQSEQFRKIKFIEAKNAKHTDNNLEE